MPGPKLNEAPVRRTNGMRPDPEVRGTRALARYVRVSPYKVREVLDLIRGQDIGRAREILRLTQRDAARVVAKVLNSAVANAEHNGSVPEDELYVSACFADEGPTLKRWRPRARGRATRIRKRTCHITVIVSRLPEAELLGRRAEQAARRARRAGEGRRRRGRPAEMAAGAPTPAAVHETTAEPQAPEMSDEAAGSGSPELAPETHSEAARPDDATAAGEPIPGADERAAAGDDVAETGGLAREDEE